MIVGGESKGNLTGGIDRQLRAVILTRFIGQRLTGLASKERASDLKVLAEHIAAGTVTPSIDRTYPLDRVPAAMRHLEAGKRQGKDRDHHLRPANGRPEMDDKDGCVVPTEKGMVPGTRGFTGAIARRGTED